MKTIAIDFDGVIHKYSEGWKDGSIYDEEIPGAFEHISCLLNEGYSVFILSTRKPRQIKRWLDDVVDMHYTFSVTWTVKVIPFWKKFWNEKNVIGVTNRKLPAHVYVDDRALRFDGKWIGFLPSIRLFKTYPEREAEELQKEKERTIDMANKYDPFSHGFLNSSRGTRHG